MGLGLAGRQRIISGYGPIKPAILSFANGAAIVRRHWLAKQPQCDLPRRGWWKEGSLPRMTVIGRAQQVATEENEVAVAMDALEFPRRVGLEQSPTIARAEDGAIAKLDHARILRAAEWVR